MTDREIRHVVGYIRSLGCAEAVPLPGDAAKGKALYVKRDCSKCHVVNGQGGTLGPDLTDVGRRRGVAHLRQVLLDPGSSKLIDTYDYHTFLNVQVATHDGRVLRGLHVNEDSFTIQLRDADNTLHSIEKREVAEIKRELEASAMPGYVKTFIRARDR